MAQSDLSIGEIKKAQGVHGADIRELFNRTMELRVAYRTCVDLETALNVLHALSTVARDLPQLVHTINETGVVHPAYVPQDVWTAARDLLDQQSEARRMFLPETRGSNATWFHANQTLAIHVPTSCDMQPHLFYKKSMLMHFNTTLELAFSNWTDAQVVSMEETRRFREMA
jgi:hypothetical protein